MTAGVSADVNNFPSLKLHSALLKTPSNENHVFHLGYMFMRHFSHVKSGEK